MLPPDEPVGPVPSNGKSREEDVEVKPTESSSHRHRQADSSDYQNEVESKSVRCCGWDVYRFFSVNTKISFGSHEARDDREPGSGQHRSQGPRSDRQASRIKTSAAKQNSGPAFTVSSLLSGLRFPFSVFSAEWNRWKRREALLMNSSDSGCLETRFCSERFLFRVVFRFRFLIVPHFSIVIFQEFHSIFNLINRCTFRGSRVRSTSDVSRLLRRGNFSFFYGSFQGKTRFHPSRTDAFVWRKDHVHI